MAVQVIDYSAFYFCTIQRGDLPVRREGKFVVIAGPCGRWAVFSPRELAFYHANVVERFLREQNVPGEYNMKGDLFFVESPDWNVEGGALWRLDQQDGRLEVFGHSAGYGPLDLRGIAQDLREVGAFGGVEIVVLR